jgi:hypothetical protein
MATILKPSEIARQQGQFVFHTDKFHVSRVFRIAAFNATGVLLQEVKGALKSEIKVSEEDGTTTVWTLADDVQAKMVQSLVPGSDAADSLELGPLSTARKLIVDDYKLQGAYTYGTPSSRFQTINPAKFTGRRTPGQPNFEASAAAAQPRKRTPGAKAADSGKKKKKKASSGSSKKKRSSSKGKKSSGSSKAKRARKVVVKDDDVAAEEEEDDQGEEDVGEEDDSGKRKAADEDDDEEEEEEEAPVTKKRSRASRVDDKPAGATASAAGVALPPLENSLPPATQPQ